MYRIVATTDFHSHINIIAIAIIILTCIQYLRRIHPSRPPEENWALLCYHEPNFVLRSSKHRPTQRVN